MDALARPLATEREVDVALERALALLKSGNACPVESLRPLRRALAALQAVCENAYQLDRLRIVARSLSQARCPASVGDATPRPSAFDEETRAGDTDGIGVINFWCNFA